VRRVKTDQSMVDFWQKKSFICSAQHPNIASCRLCAWLSFSGVKRTDRHAFIRLHLVLKMKLWRCSSARSPRTALPYLHIIDLLSNTLHLCSSVAWERRRMMNHRQPAVFTMCFALRESTGLLQNVWNASDCNESFVTTFWTISSWN